MFDESANHLKFTAKCFGENKPVLIFHGNLKRYNRRATPLTFRLTNEHFGDKWKWKNVKCGANHVSVILRFPLHNIDANFKLECF